MKKISPPSSHLAIVLTSALVAPSALAGPQAFNGARSFGMGGTGVASALPGAASFHNPAMLAMQQSGGHGDFALTFPSISGRYADDKNVISQVDDIQSTIDDFNRAVNLYQNNPQDAGALNQAKGDANTLAKQLTALNQDRMRADLGTGLALAVPGKTVAFSVFADVTFRATVKANVAQSDINFLQQAAAGQINGQINKGSLINGYQVKSNGSIVAAAIGEAGVSLAHLFQVKGNPLTVGISPKLLDIRTFNYDQDVSNFDKSNFNASDHETTDNKFDFDMGAAYRFGVNQEWTAGLAVRNVIPISVDSAPDSLGNTYQLKIDPKVTAAIAQSHSWHTIALEADLTPTKSFGYDNKTQWLALGAEANAFDTMQFRLGVRHNIANNSVDHGIKEDNQLTAGVGFSPFGFNIEASGLISSSDKGAAIELAFNF